MRLAAFKDDKNKVENGVWEEIADGLMVRVASLDNDAYTKIVLDNVDKIGKAKKNKNTLSAIRDAEKIMCRALASSVLLDWKNLQDDDGNDIGYSEDKAFEILFEHKRFRDAVLEIAKNESLYYAEVKEEQEKN